MDGKQVENVSWLQMQNCQYKGSLIIKGESLEVLWDYMSKLLKCASAATLAFL